VEGKVGIGHCRLVAGGHRGATLLEDRARLGQTPRVPPAAPPGLADPFGRTRGSSRPGS
jgi:hypothetical protein